MIAILSYVVQVLQELAFASASPGYCLHCVCLPHVCTICYQLIFCIRDTERVALTFWEFTARFSRAKSDDGSTVPKKMDLYWFMPALANNKVGSECGTTDDEGTCEKI